MFSFSLLDPRIPRIYTWGVCQRAIKELESHIHNTNEVNNEPYRILQYLQKTVLRTLDFPEAWYKKTLEVDPQAFSVKNAWCTLQLIKRREDYGYAVAIEHMGVPKLLEEFSEGELHMCSIRVDDVLSFADRITNTLLEIRYFQGGTRQEESVTTDNLTSKPSVEGVTTVSSLEI